jgi:S-formylglutathione hydrolase FrmB
VGWRTGLFDDDHGAMPRHNFARPRGDLVEVTIESDALAGNLLGDPTTRTVAVYLPEGYEGGDQHYPLLVDLVGFTGSGLAHLAWRAFGESVPQRVDRLVSEGHMGPVVVAFPDCFTSLGGNQYVDSAVMGDWERFLIEEMVPRLEAGFRIMPGRDHRGVFGKSSGGYGAIAHGLRRADAWAAVACHSGDMDFDLCYRPDFPKAIRAVAEKGGIEAWLDWFFAEKKADSDPLHVIMMLAMAASYDPDPSAPRGIRLPVDLDTAELDEERWARWVAHDPVHMIEDLECQENLRSLRALYIDCGHKDQYHLVHGARRFVRRLTELGIDHRYDEFDDDHSNIDYRMDESLPYLYAALS